MSMKHGKTLQRNQLSSRKQSKSLVGHSICANEPHVSADEAAMLPAPELLCPEPAQVSF